MIAHSLDLLEWLAIPAGQVTLAGSQGSYLEPFQTLTVKVQPFAIARFPITNGQFQVFLDAAYADTSWWEFSPEATAWRASHPTPIETTFPGSLHPRTNVSWYDAIAFCRWLSAQTGDHITLPTEQQWQRAAQGDTAWAYPWGDDFDSAYCNSSVTDPHPTTTQVTHYIDAPSPYGVVDMTGNVWEWCLTKHETGGTELTGDHARVLRGGCWRSDLPDFLRVDFRNWYYPDTRLINRGFRPIRL